MANLIPEYEKRKTRKEYNLRLVSVALFLSAVLLIIAIVILSPSFILSSYKYNSASVQLGAEKKKISDAITGIDPIKEAKEVNVRLVTLGQGDFTVPASYDAFVTILGYKPQNLKITALFYDRSESEGKITLSGISKNRETLLLFLQLLESEEKFSDVDLPISSFVEGSDIDFTIQIVTEAGIIINNDNNEEK